MGFPGDPDDQGTTVLQTCVSRTGTSKLSLYSKNIKRSQYGTKSACVLLQCANPCHAHGINTKLHFLTSQSKTN